MHLSMLNLRGEGVGGGGPWAYVGHLIFQRNFWSKSSLWGPKTWSDQKSPGVPSIYIENE